MGSRVGIYPGGPQSGGSDPAHPPGVRAPQARGYGPHAGNREDREHRERAAGIRLLHRIAQARRSRQLLWVVLAVALSAFIGLRLASKVQSAPASIQPGTAVYESPPFL